MTDFSGPMIPALIGKGKYRKRKERYSMKKRILASLMSLCLLVGLLPTAAFAAENDVDGQVPSSIPYTELGEGDGDTPDKDDTASEDDSVPAANPAATGDTFTVDNITYEVTGNNTVSVTKKGDGTLYSGDITIPSTVSYENTTYDVTAIGKDAFSRCTNLGKVSVPSSVKTIGQTAFGYITGGTNKFSIQLEEGVETIGAEAFIGSRNLKSIEIPASVTTLGNGIFQNSTNLKTVTFAENSTLTAIPDDCFYCTAGSALSSITLPGSITSIGRGAFCGTTSLKSIHIPAGVTEIPENAFYNTALETVTGLDGVTKIGNSAFKNTCLTGEFTIPSTVTEIGNSAFASTDFTKVTFEAESQLSSIGSKAFQGCRNLQEIALPDTVTELPTQIFDGCSALATVTLPSNIPAIPANAFKNCTSLGSIKLPESVSELDGTAFSGCTSLKTIDTSDSKHFVSEDGLFYNADKTELLRVLDYKSSSYEIPDSLATIAEGALVGTTITAITFPENSTRTAIDANMFKNCTNLTSVTLPAGLKTIGDSAFLGCTGLTEIVIPAGVTSIGNSAFSICSSLASVTLPDTLTALGTSAFQKTGLTSVALPNHLEMISDRAFYECKNLTSVDFPKSLNEIGDEAFYGTALSEIMIPQGTEVIGSEAFGQTMQISKVVVPDSVTEIGTRAFFLLKDAVYVMAPTSLTISGSGPKNIYSNNTLQFPVTVYCPAEMAAQHKQMLNNNKEATISSFTLSMPAAVSVAAGSKTTLEASVAPSDSQLTVESSDPSKATVSATEIADGISTISISALAAGETTITATLKVAGLEVLKDTCTVTVTAEGAVIPSVEEPKTNTDKISDADDKSTASEVAGSVAADETISSAAQSAANSLNSSAEKASLIEKGNTELNPTSEQKVSLYTQTYLNIEATELTKKDASVTSITLNITPMMQVVASTANNSADVELEGNGKNAVVVKEAAPLTIHNASEITVTLPSSFVGQTVYVKHEASNGGTYFYTATADAEGKITFTSKHGFSPFTFSTTTNEAVAEIEDVGYSTLDAAVQAVQNGQTIKLLKDCGETVTISREISFKLERADDVNFTGKIEAGYRYSVSEKDGTYTVTYVGGGSSGGGSSSSSDYIVSVENSKHGTVTVSPKRAEKGDTVTITVRPDKGYELDGLTVTDKNGDKIKLTEKSDNKYTFKMPGSKVTVDASFKLIGTEPEAPVFADVPADAYYADAVAWAVKEGITSGTGTNTFSPNASCTRAQMVTFLWRANGSPKATKANPFTDVSADAYYYDAVLWAAEKGITSGTSATTFSPDAVLTRGQTVTFLWRANGSPVVNYAMNFTDVDGSAYYGEAVRWAVSEGITAGTGGNNFSPDAPCTRAQIVTFMYRDAK